jgi:NADH-quinone oxidoreductase subunit J
MEAFFFYLLGALTLVSGVAVIALRRPVHNAIALIFAFFFLAGIYLLLHAEFVAVLQVLVYAGAIMVLFLFVIMLLNLEREPVEARSQVRGKWFGVILAIVILLLLLPVWTMQILPAVKGSFPPEKVHEVGNTVWVARVLFTDYLLLFEVASVLLLAAIVGAVFFTQRKPAAESPEEQPE